jgi:inhibitor of cysteine peptidase
MKMLDSFSKKRKGLAGLIFLLLYFYLLPVSAAAEKISLKQSASPQDVTLKTGDELELTLPGNPTTGYTWQKVAGDEKILAQNSDYKYTPDTKLIGSGGKFVFTFKAATAGETRLRFAYQRTFEKNIPPVKIFEVTVIVK